jgi:hypothetical protein
MIFGIKIRRADGSTSHIAVAAISQIDALHTVEQLFGAERIAVMEVMDISYTLNKYFDNAAFLAN